MVGSSEECQGGGGDVGVRGGGGVCGISEDFYVVCVRKLLSNNMSSSQHDGKFM